MKRFFKVSALLVILVMLITLVACTDSTETKNENENEKTDTTETAESSVWDSAWYTEDAVIGDGQTQIKVEIKAEDKSIVLTINTDAGTLGDALLTYALIDGESSQYGMYVKSVNQIVADYDKDGYYWAFYKDKQYLMTGVDTTVISDGDYYEIVREK